MPHAFAHRSFLSLLVGSCVLGGVGGQPLAAQDSHRIWGRVTTVSGAQHEGFIRWDRNEASWVDVLDGSKDALEENYQIWLDANADGERPVRALELRGYRITWDEEDPDFPDISSSGVRFGHLAQLILTGDDEAEIVLRSGERLTLSGGASDIGRGMRDLLVTDSDGDGTELEWEDVDRVDFSPVPPGAHARDVRLYGTVIAERGRQFTGYIGWDTDEALESDVLDGDDEDGYEREVSFGDIRSIEGHRNWSSVTLRSGEVLQLEGSNDVGRGHRGVQVSDPALGLVDVDWDAFESIEFQSNPESGANALGGDPFDYGAFDGGHLLYGTVVTWDDKELTGFIRWDADEQWSWEFLDGSKDDVSYQIEFSHIQSVHQDERLGVLVTLTDGRSIELEDGNDVDWDNKGILVSPRLEDGAGDVAPAQNPSWLYLFWEDVREVHFDHESGRLRAGAGS